METLGTTLGWASLVEIASRLAVAFLFAIPIAWDREAATRTMGLRTFPLVSIASCAYVMLATEVLGAHSAEHSRIIQGLMTGIGFIGGGAILKTESGVRGTATAASVWATGATGAAVGYGLYEIGAMVMTVGFFTLRALEPLKEEINGSSAAEGSAGEGAPRRVSTPREVDPDEARPS